MAFLAQLILGCLMVYLFFSTLGFWFGLGVLALWLLIGMANSGKR
ncbi:hypothetical protein [Acidovorax sp.]|jgi:hypothetical protein|nr:hypothetical protein [Acidovorax sp.]